MKLHVDFTEEELEAANTLMEMAQNWAAASSWALTPEQAAVVAKLVEAEETLKRLKPRRRAT